jgi:hypothetical protein
LKKPEIEVCTATCYAVEKALGAAPPKKIYVNDDDEDEEEGKQGIGKVRIFMIALLLLFIYFVWAHDIQFGDIKHFIIDNKAKLGL